MIDPTNNATQQLPSEPVSRGRGRPSTGQALSNAERQKAYRLRQKELRNDKSENDLSAQVEMLQRLLSESTADRMRLAEMVLRKKELRNDKSEVELLQMWLSESEEERVRLTTESVGQKAKIIGLEKIIERKTKWINNAVVELNKLGFTDFKALDGDE